MEVILKKHLLLVMLFWSNNFIHGLQNNTEDKPDVSEESTTLKVLDNNVQSTDKSFTAAITSGCTGGGVMIMIFVSVMYKILKKRQNNRNNCGHSNTGLQLSTSMPVAEMEITEITETDGYPLADRNEKQTERQTICTRGLRPLPTPSRQLPAISLA